MTHELKIWPEFYQRVADGSKTFELRRNDRHFQMVDTVHLKEFNPRDTDIANPKGKFTGVPDINRTIGFILPVPDSDNLVVFSLLPLPPTAKGGA